MKLALPSRLVSVQLAFGLLLLIAIYLVVAHPAFAQASTYGTTNFRCNGAIASGTLYDSSLICPTTIRAGNIFSFLVCNMERLASNLLGQMFCGVITDLTPAVMAMCTLAVLMFGMGFTIGVIPATARDFQMFLLKIVFVVVFATQSDYIIGTGYNLLVTGLREGTAIGLSTMMSPNGSANVTGLDVYKYLDAFLGKTMHFATDYVGMKWDGKDNPCKNALFAVMAIMAIAFPPIFFLAIMIIFRICITFMRAVFGYLYSIIGIVFLLTLSPFFLSFYLFRQTRPFFDKWIGYLVSFSLQMVILFAFLAFILTIDVKHVSGSLTSIVVPNREAFEGTSIRAPWKYCTLCDFEVIDKQTKEVIPDTQYEGFLKDGELRCKTPVTPISITDASGPGSTTTKHGITSALLKFASTGLLSLFVLAYVVEYVLTFVPALAAMLASGLGGYAPQLGGAASTGGGNKATFGQRPSIDMPGGTLLDTFEQGFTDGYSANMKYTGLGAATMGVKKGMERLVLGGQGNRQSGGKFVESDGKDGLMAGANDPGMLRVFSNFMFNPQGDPDDRG